MPPKKTTRNASRTPTPDKSVPEVVTEVLRGSWGSYDGLRDRLTEAGYDATEVFTSVNERLTRGAPAAYKASPFQLAEQVKRGEWGEADKLEKRLSLAGINPIDVLGAR